MQWLRRISLVLGLVLLGFAVSRSGGFASIGSTLVRMRWWLALAVLYALSSIAFAAAAGVAYFTHWGIVASIGLGAAGLMLGIARRIRSLFWSALGLLLLLNFSRAPAIGGKLDFSRYPSEQLSE